MELQYRRMRPGQRSPPCRAQCSLLRPWYYGSNTVDPARAPGVSDYVCTHTRRNPEVQGSNSSTRLSCRWFSNSAVSAAKSSP
eukprot:1648011-Pyramimonas_sp.AAC.1